MRLKELWEAKVILEDKKRTLKAEETHLNLETKKTCLEAYPEALTINWKTIHRMISHR